MVDFGPRCEIFFGFGSRFMTLMIFMTFKNLFLTDTDKELINERARVREFCILFVYSGLIKP